MKKYDSQSELVYKICITTLCQSFLPVRLVPLAKLITLIINNF